MEQSEKTSAKAKRRRKASSEGTAHKKQSGDQTKDTRTQAKKSRPAHAAPSKKSARAEAASGTKQARHVRTQASGQATRDARKKPSGKKPSGKKPSGDEPRQRRASTSDQAQRTTAPDEGLLGKVLPVLAIALALVGATLLYRYVFPPAIATEEAAAGDLENAESAEDANAASSVYNGVESPYTYSGYFSTGNDELDLQIKTFCDTIADPTLEARDNAQKVFEKIAQSPTYVTRSMSDMPGGPEWYLVCAEQYFASSVPDQGVPGAGDYYDYAAAICYCLRYFGFSDALAIPLTDASGTSYGQAAVVVTDVTGTSCVCDPSKPYAGWMLDSYTQNLLVQNIGQDTAQEEAMGLTVLEVEADTTGMSQQQG